MQNVNEILWVQSNPTKDTEELFLLYYAATYPNSIIRYEASDMVLYVDLDAEYLTMPEARGYYARHLLAITKADKTYPQDKQSYPQRMQNNTQ